MGSKKLDDILKDEIGSSDDMDRLVFDEGRKDRRSRNNTGSIPRK